MKTTYVAVISYNKEGAYMVTITAPWKSGEELEELLAKKFDLGDINYIVVRSPKFGKKKITQVAIK